MILTKRNSRNDLITLNNLLDGFLNHSFTKSETSCTNKPKVNIVETDNEFKLQIALPGIAKDSININVDDDLLTISNASIKNNEKKADETTTDEKSVENKSVEKDEPKFLRKEFNYNSFKRTFTLPDTINANEINAANENGILTITLPKKEAAKAIKKTINIS